MDTDLLRTFIEVSHTRHFGKAAQQLFVTQSTVSARIRQLEELVGTPLLTRARHDIQLTSAGRRLLRYAEQILTTWNRARQEIAVGEVAVTPLTVAGMPSLWDILLQDWLQDICQRFEHIALTVEAHHFEFIARRLADGSIDLGFMFEPPQIPELKTVKISRVPLVMVSSQPGQTAARAVGKRYILVDWGTTFAIAHAQSFPDAPPPLLRMSLGRLAREFLLGNGGCAYLAQPMVADDLQAGRLYMVSDAPVIERDAYASYAAHSDIAPLIEQLLGVLPWND
jgi:DNA-binding transcriptional LysR family regulator